MNTEALGLLTTGSVTVLGRLPHSSNYTFLVLVSPRDGGADAVPSENGSPPFVPPTSLDATLFAEAEPGCQVAVYKPGDGERPLWDFPGGLYKREIASYRLSSALGWDIVPETVARDDAPLGPGSLQRFVDADFETHYFHLAEEERFHDALVTVAVFDVLVNNTDRKAGHLLLDADERIWAIDNGLAFHEESKLRTVIWDFAGEPIPDHLIASIASVAEGDGALLDPLVPYLDAREIAALGGRARSLLRTGRMPSIQPGERPYPWPII